MVDVVFGLSRKSPPTPATTPTIAAAATALLHFRALLLETLLLAILSSFESDKTLFPLLIEVQKLPIRDC